MKRATFTFKGKSSHAAASPHKGVNALRGVLLTFNCVDSLREHLRQDVRIHGIVTKGGAVVNVVPELAQAEFACRALDTATMENAYAKIVNCAKAAELGTGATLEFKEPRVALKATITDPRLLETVQANLKTLGIAGNQFRNFDELASSDLGMVSYTYPTVNLWFKIAPEGTAAPQRCDARSGKYRRGLEVHTDRRQSRGPVGLRHADQPGEAQGRSGRLQGSQGQGGQIERDRL